MFLLGMPFLLSTYSVAMMIAIGSMGGESITFLPADEASAMVPSLVPVVAPGTIVVTCACSPVSEVKGDVTSDTSWYR